jgi:hypothetical protein
MARRKKRGPKRKPGPRYPCGKRKLVRANPLGDDASSDDPLVRELAEWTESIRKFASDPRQGSELGRLEMEGVLTPAEAAAGQRYAEIVGRYERLVGFRSRHPSSVDYLGGSSRYDTYVRSDEEADDLVRRAKKDYDEARLLIPPYPSAAHRIIDEVCCNDREINPSCYPGLIDVLDNLAKAWGLDCLNRHDAEVDYQQAGY